MKANADYVIFFDEYTFERRKMMKRVYDFLKKAETYYLATVEGDQPRVRPFGTINEFEGKLYIQTGKVKPVSHQIAGVVKDVEGSFGGIVGDQLGDAAEHDLAGEIAVVVIVGGYMVQQRGLGVLHGSLDRGLIDGDNGRRFIEKEPGIGLTGTKGQGHCKKTQDG